MVLSLFHKVVVFSKCTTSFIYLVVRRNFFNRLLCSFIGTYKFFSVRLGMFTVNIKHCFLPLLFRWSGERREVIYARSHLLRKQKRKGGEHLCFYHAYLLSVVIESTHLYLLLFFFHFNFSCCLEERAKKKGEPFGSPCLNFSSLFCNELDLFWCKMFRSFEEVFDIYAKEFDKFCQIFKRTPGDSLEVFFFHVLSY